MMFNNIIKIDKNYICKTIYLEFLLKVFKYQKNLIKINKCSFLKNNYEKKKKKFQWRST